MIDPIHNRFVAAQRQMAADFAAANPDLCDILALPDSKFLVHFRCPVLVRRSNGDPELADGCDVGISFGPDYCRRVDPGFVSVLSPAVFHPNILAHHPILAGMVCLGRSAPATGISDILCMTYELLIWHAFSSNDCLNPEAAQWVRNHPDRVPLESCRAVRIPKREGIAH